MSVLAILAAAGAVIALWTGATRYTGTVARGYRWLGGAALFWFAGLIITQVEAGQISSAGLPLSLADVAPLLALASAATGVMVLADGVRKSDSGSVLPGLADGYVMAVALLVIGWVLGFGAEFHHLGERPQTFLGDLLLPLADLAVLGALLPVLTVAWRRVLVPYVALLALTGADSLGVGARINGGHEGILEQLADDRGRVPVRPGPLGGDHRRAVRPAAGAHLQRGARRRRRPARTAWRAAIARHEHGRGHHHRGRRPWSSRRSWSS